MVQYGLHHVIVARFTYIGCAQTERLGPQFVVRQTVGADDTKARELLMQTLNFARPRSFQIQHDRLSAIPGNRRQDLLAGAGQTNRPKVLGKTGRQNLCRSGVVLIKDYIACFHITPLTAPQIRGGLGCDSKHS
jgi:hypothetical protein